MNDKEFTKDLFNLYVRQRKQLDESVPKDIKQKYIKKEENYEAQKQRQKERYHKRVAEGGAEYRQKLREINKTNLLKRKAKKLAESTQKEEDSRPASPMSRYVESITRSAQTQSGSESDDLESVFSEDVEIKHEVRKNVFNNFIGF
jgi:type II secretory ATPase GspE/PulE/Tfp pilus assembly ATPase PilB-like protein